MNLIDTHAHLYAEEFENDIDEVVLKAKAVGVSRILLPNIDVESIPALKKAVKTYPDFFVPMMGIHPTSIKDDWEKQLHIIYDELNNGRYVAVGEIGIDLYWDKTYEKQQIEAFENQLKWSIDKQLPVSIHSRNATYEVIRSIKRVGAKSLRGVFHSFGGNTEELNAVMALQNFYIGINGVVTFKNSGLSETLANGNVSRIILETDAPYLAPAPYRGKRNESSYLPEIACKLAEIYKMSQESIANITSDNALQLFGLNNW